MCPIHLFVLGCVVKSHIDTDTDPMGLTGFYPLLQKQGSYVPYQVSLEELRDKTVALDGDFFLYKALHGYTTGEQVGPHELADRVSKWLELATSAGIRPVFITTGGPPPIEKQAHCGQVRKRKRERSQEVIEELESKLLTESDLGEELHMRNKICRLRNSIRRISTDISRQIVEILVRRGFECRSARSEADFMLVMMSEDQQCDYVATDDADILVSGATHVIRGFVRMLVASDTRGSVFCRQDVMACLGLSSQELLQLGTLLSCDYQPAIHNVGPVTALRMIQQHRTVDAFLRSAAFETQTTSRPNKKRKYTLPSGMSVEAYSNASNRSVGIFQSRPDKEPDITPKRNGDPGTTLYCD
jgi:flap endonuclease-1